MGDKGVKKNDGLSVESLGDMKGVESLIREGIIARNDRRVKNRIIFFLCALLLASMTWNITQTLTRPEPRLLGETTDGRIRPLPLLSDPMFTQKEILGWAEECVSDIYNLSYVDWKRSIANNTQCLSDKGRADFASSLKKIGVMGYLTPERQGTIYATPGKGVMQKSWLTPSGYAQWIVEVPYRIQLDGKQRGSLDVVMIMKIRRVSLTWREEGIWVDEYQVLPRAARTAGGA